MTIQVLTVGRTFLLEHPAIVDQVAELYCSIWEQDSNFGEYKQCPRCQRYYSYADVSGGISKCLTCNEDLVKAWEPQTVKQTLLDVSKHHSFACSLLVDDMAKNVWGFSWGRLFSIEEMTSQWGAPFAQLAMQNIQALFCFHLEELAIAPELRGYHFGLKLAKDVLMNPFGRYPHVIGTVATHKNSVAVNLYENLGYRKIADHPMGQGRICLGIASIIDLNLFTYVGSQDYA